MRDYLVYIPCKESKVVANLWDESRTYDIALNDYTGSSIPKPVDDNPAFWSRVDFTFHEKGHKWPVIGNMGYSFDSYKAVCFLDDDVEINTEQMNRLFYYGRIFGWNLWQAALTLDSIGTHRHLFKQVRSWYRPAKWVEIMAPIFSREALETCASSFSLSESGYGLDLLWPKLLNNRGLIVVDTITMKHRHPITSTNWKLSNGKSPAQELSEIVDKYDLGSWIYGQST